MTGAEIKCTVHSVQIPHKPVMKSKQRALRAYCPNIYTVPLGKNFHHVYNLAMSEPVTQTHEYREAFQYLKMSERIGLIETLTTFSQSLRKNGKLHCTQSYAVFLRIVSVENLRLKYFNLNYQNTLLF